MRVIETDIDYVIWITIQRKLKSKIWSAQLSYFYFLTYEAKASIFLLNVHYVDANQFNFHELKYKQCFLRLRALHITGEEAGQSKNMN